MLGTLLNNYTQISSNMDPSITQPQPVPQAGTPPPPPASSPPPPPPIDPYYGDESGDRIKKILLIAGAAIGAILLIVGIVFAISLFTRPKESGNVTLTYWGVWEDASVIQPLVDDYQRQHPNVKINYQKQDIKSLGDYTARLTTRLAKEDGPDIVRYHSSWVPQLKSYLRPFPKSTVENTKLETDYYKTVERDMKINGAYYGIPLGIDTLALFVNTQLLTQIGAQPPATMVDLADIARQLTVPEDGKIRTSGVALGTFDNIAHAPDIVAMFMLQDGADWKKPAGSARESTENSLRFYTYFSSREIDQRTWDDTLDNSKLAFAKGNLGMYFGYSWDIFEIKATNPNLEFQVVKVPNVAGGRKNTVASYWVEGVSAKSPNSKAAFEFLEYLSKPETLQKMYELQTRTRLFGTLYPRKSMFSLLQSNQLIFPFLSQGDDAQSTGFSSDTYDGETGINTQLNVYLGNAIRSINTNTSIGSAVDTLGAGVTQVLSRYGE